jgi:hypothetical protein
VTVAPEPTPTPPTPPPAPPGQRPDLRLVPFVVPPETAEEITGPIPVIHDEPDDEASPVDTAVDADPRAVTPQAPLDVRLLEAVNAFLRLRPHWSERPPSAAESWEYSTTGDWTVEEKSVKRVLHGLCVLVAFIGTYPIAWVVQIARHKPIGFLLTLAVVFVLGKVL